MAKFLLMLWGDEQAQASVSPEELQGVYDAYQRVTDEMRSAKVFEAGEGIQPSNTARTVKVVDGRTKSVNGPVPTGSDQINGFYLLECKDIGEAERWAAKVPAAAQGAIEVRPVIDYPG
jgi:hypothetical protein